MHMRSLAAKMKDPQPEKKYKGPGAAMHAPARRLENADVLGAVQGRKTGAGVVPGKAVISELG